MFQTTVSIVVASSLLFDEILSFFFSLSLSLLFQTTIKFFRFNYTYIYKHTRASRSPNWTMLLFFSDSIFDRIVWWKTSNDDKTKYYYLNGFSNNNKRNREREQKSEHIKQN